MMSESRRLTTLLTTLLAAAVFFALIPALYAQLPAAVAAQRKNVCQIRVGLALLGASNVGSGCYLGNGYVLTCRHVFDDSRRRDGVAVFADGQRFPFELVAWRPRFDTAVVRLKRLPTLDGAKVASQAARRGEKLYLCGWSTGRPGFRPGVYSQAVAPRTGLEPAWGIMLAGNCGSAVSGDSGGPVFNERGEVVGNLWGSGNGETVYVRNPLTLALLEPYKQTLQICGPSGCRPSPIQKPDPPTTPLVPIQPAPPRLTDSQVDRLAELLLERMANDERFRGPPGPPGPTGPPGRPGQDHPQPPHPAPPARTPAYFEIVPRE